MKTKVCVGGTFNVIHEGHIALLGRAFREGDEVFIGLTSDRMARGKRSCEVLPFGERMDNLTEALVRMSGGKPFEVFEIDDEFGPAATGNFDVIVVSEETAGTAERINDARAAAGLKRLRIVVVGMVLNGDGRRISSTEIIASRREKDNP